MPVVRIGAKRITPQEVSAVILGELRERASRHFGETVNRAPVRGTMPAQPAPRPSKRNVVVVAVGRVVQG